MKKILIRGIRFYQSMPFKSHHSCRFVPTCSNYTIQAIEQYGSFRGMWMGIKRIVRCNPFGRSGYDPVPMKEKKK